MERAYPFSAIQIKGLEMFPALEASAAEEPAPTRPVIPHNHLSGQGPAPPSSASANGPEDPSGEHEPRLSQESRMAP